MFESTIKTYQFDNGEIQRVQAVTADSFDDLRFLFPSPSSLAFGKIVNLYKSYIVPRCPWIFGRMILYYLPDEELKKEVAAMIIGGEKASRGCGSLEESGDECGISMSEDARICDFLRRNVRVRGSNLVFKNALAKDVCEKIIDAGYFSIVCGKLSHTKILPVGNTLGFLSESLPDAKMKVNSNFFVMDCFDVASIYDKIGSPIGLMVKDGVVINPPSYDREALLVMDDGSVEIKSVGLKDVTVEIGGKIFGVNATSDVGATILERPSSCKISRCANLFGHGKYVYLVIVGTKVVGIHKKGGFDVPSAGVVVKMPVGELASDGLGEKSVHVGDEVRFAGFEHVKFGVQVGNSIIVNGKKTTGFISKFYNIYRHLGAKAYPPSLYPLDFEGARAARVALGATADGKPVILLAEGSKKTGYVPGEQSRGATLSDMVDFAEDFGLYNAVNLDGGGSAQMLIDNERTLSISDRNPDDTDAERGVPVGIYLA